jgi:uncharacterized protein (DUF983 family)
MNFSLPALLTVLFVGLKLTNYIAWSWWWVLSPLWIGFTVVFILSFLITLTLDNKKSKY